MNTPNNRQKGQRKTQDGSGAHEPVQVARVAALVAQRNKGGQSLRVLAKEIGVSKSEVDGLVKAHNRERPMPQPHVAWPRLRKWYLRERLLSDGGLQESADMALAVDQILGDIPAADQPSATALLLASVSEIYDRFETARPAWLQHLVQPTDTEPSSPPAPSE